MSTASKTKIDWDAADKTFYNVEGEPKKEFGKSLGLWLAAFTAYTRLAHRFFSETHPTLLPALLLFMSEIKRLAFSYNWQNHILLLALATQNIASYGGVMKIEGWEVKDSSVKFW